MVQSANTVGTFFAVTLMVGSLDHLKARICTHLTPPVAFNPRTLESRYKSPVRRRREYYEPRRCNAKVGTDLKCEFKSCFYNVDRVVNKIQELKRNVQDLDGSKYYDDTFQQENLLEPLPENKINDLKDAHNTIMTCLREMEKIKTFLEDENSWWKILKNRSVDCCQQKLPHLHGILDGASVTLMLLEEGTDEVPRRFVTSTPKEKNITAPRFGTSPREWKNKVKQTEQYTNHRMDKYADSYTVPHYSLDAKSALIEVTSTDSHEPIQRHNKRAAMSEQNVASEFWTEAQEGESDEQKIPETSHRFKETHDKQYEDKEKRTSNNVLPRDIRYGQDTQNTFEDTMKPQETFSTNNSESKKHITNDFESNVDLNTTRKMKKILIIARSPACTIDDELKMGSKTTVILREYAIIRSAVSTPTISCRNKDSTSFDGSTCTLTLESYEVCLKRKKDTIVDKRRLECCKSTEKIKPSSFKGKCSKSCTKTRKTNSNRPQTSDKPQTLCESSSCRQKKSKTKPTGEMPLFAQLKTKIKKTSRKFQSTLPFFKKTTKRTMARVKSLYGGSRPKRALGFKCDLKKCSSTLMECSAGACRKKSMIFGEPIQPCSSKMTDSSASDTSTEPSTSENRF
ncbi:hypothetical protein ALC53_08553 [Atta colombica]|uniref:Uncharacterized protein n=1 Tax=Atta colombica TaxID=520822 RepID=A0A151I2B5_9HYME|nr:hypothetical protein ALC53_08553 [Atta colombica]